MARSIADIGWLKLNNVRLGRIKVPEPKNYYIVQKPITGIQYYQVKASSPEEAKSIVDRKGFDAVRTDFCITSEFPSTEADCIGLVDDPNLL